MPLPSDIDTTTVTGQYLKFNGSPASGRVRFSPTVGVMVHAGESKFVMPVEFLAPLDTTGAFSIALPATDSPALDPTGFQYRVTEEISGFGRPEFYIDAPTGSPDIDLTQVTPAAPTLPVSEQFSADARYGRLAVGNTWADSQTLESSFAGGEDTTDSTSRMNLESYQSSPINAWGEVIRTFLRKAKAKAMHAWYFPASGYDANGDPVGTFRPVVWTGAHWRSSDGATLHKHWSIETPDSTGALQTRLEVVFGDTAVDNGVAGLDKTRIVTHDADFVVRCQSTGSQLRLAGSAGVEKGLQFSNDALGTDAARRWKVRQNSTAEAGSDAGSDFEIVRYTDAGTANAALFISRADANVGIRTTAPTARLDVNGDTIRVRTARTPATAGAAGNAGDIAWDSNFIYVCVATNTWKRVAIATW